MLGFSLVTSLFLPFSGSFACRFTVTALFGSFASYFTVTALFWFFCLLLHCYCPFLVLPLVTSLFLPVVGCGQGLWISVSQRTSRLGFHLARPSLYLAVFSPAIAGLASGLLYLYSRHKVSRQLQQKSEARLTDSVRGKKEQNTSVCCCLVVVVVDCVLKFSFMKLNRWLSLVKLMSRRGEMQYWLSPTISAGEKNPVSSYLHGMRTPSSPHGSG